MKELRIDDRMSRAPIVTYADHTVTQALRVMETGRVRHLPVLEGPKLVGMVTDRDLQPLAASGEYDLRALRVRDVMLRRPYAVQIRTPLADVATEMIERRVGSAVVLDGEAVVGMFTTVDALRALAGILREPEPLAARAS